MSADTYVVVSNGKASNPMDWDAAINRGEHLGEFRGQDVKIHRVRNGKTADVVAEWKNFKQVKG